MRENQELGREAKSGTQGASGISGMGAGQSKHRAG